MDREQAWLSEEKFVVRKNTLPYVYQWAVVDTENGNKVGEYKTQKLAENACHGFRQYGLLVGEKTKIYITLSWSELAHK